MPCKRKVSFLSRPQAKFSTATISCQVPQAKSLPVLSASFTNTDKYNGAAEQTSLHAGVSRISKFGQPSASFKMLKPARPTRPSMSGAMCPSSADVLLHQLTTASSLPPHRATVLLSLLTALSLKFLPPLLVAWSSCAIRGLRSVQRHMSISMEPLRHQCLLFDSMLLVSSSILARARPSLYCQPPQPRM